MVTISYPGYPREIRIWSTLIFICFDIECPQQEGHRGDECCDVNEYHLSNSAPKMERAAPARQPMMTMAGKAKISFIAGDLLIRLVLADLSMNSNVYLP